MARNAVAGENAAEHHVDGATWAELLVCSRARGKQREVGRHESGIATATRKRDHGFANPGRLHACPHDHSCVLPRPA
jgi:hypothetical protein